MRERFMQIMVILVLGLLLVVLLQVMTRTSSRIVEDFRETAESTQAPEAERKSDSADFPTKVPANAPVTASQDAQQAEGPISRFREWAKAYLGAPDVQRVTMLAEGEALAKAHTEAVAVMIRTSPEKAIANAVPMVIRQDLPTRIVELLEERVRMKAALEVYGNVPMPGTEVSPDFKPYTRSVTKEDGSQWNAYVYGRYAARRTISTALVNGVAVGRDMAVADSPVRQLETGERPALDGRVVVEICPVSEKETIVDRTEDGKLPPVTEETPAIETAERIIYVCSGGHINQVAEQIFGEEARQHWESMGAYLNAGAGSGAPIDPLGSVPSTTTTGQRSILHIRATFPNHRVDPQSDAESHDMLRQMADYIVQTSYGRCYFTYAVAPLVILPYPESWYVQHQTDGFNADTLIQNQARTIARSMGYDYLAYDYDSVRWSGSVGSYGGSASVGGRGIRMKNNSVGTFCHELGHNLGVWHANFWRTTPPSFIGPGNNLEYGNTFDLMGSSGSMGQFTSHFKNTLNWLPNETFIHVNSSGIYRIHQFDSSIADPSNRYALRIQKDAERIYWAEFRQRHGSNTGFMNGLMMTWDGWGLGGIGGSGGSPFNGSNRGAQLLDMTPGSFGNGITDTRNDSALWVGRTFSDEDSQIHITPVAKYTTTTPPSMDVHVSTGSVSGNDAPTLVIGANHITAATNAAITLTATASDPNGDPLAYAWVFDDGTYSTNNNPVQTKSWSAAGHYQVLCTVSDMKGKRTTRSILITVGSPSSFMVSGNITGPDATPLEGVFVANYVPSNNTSHPNSSTFRGTWTDSDGNYTLTRIGTGSYTITPSLYPNVFTSSGFTNPVMVGPHATGRNFTSAPLPIITITTPDSIANEGASPGTATIRLTRTGSTSNALTVQIFNTNTGTATRNSDYSLSPGPTAATNEGGSGTSQYTIPAGASFLEITVTPINDTASEGVEFAALNFANTSGGYLVSGSAVATVSIADDESPNLPVVKLTHVDNIASENGPDTATLKIERTGSTTSGLTVQLTLTGTASNGTDYAFSSPVVIPSGSGGTTFTLTPVDDSTQEGTETAIITISANAAYVRDTLSNSQTVMVYDDDLPSVSIAATDPNLSEDPGNPGIFTITRSGGNPFQALTVDYSLAGRAIHGVDYRRLEGRAVIPAGATSTSIEIYPYDDTVDEGTQDVIVQLRSTTSYSISGTGTATLSITDNEGSQVYVKLTKSGVTEPASGSTGAIDFQIIRPATGTAITVNYLISGSATSGTDFTALPGTIAFAAGDTAKTVTVSAVADTALEDTESVTLTLLAGSGYTLMRSQSPSATGFILDGDQPTVEVSAADTLSTLTTQGSETSSSLRFIFTRAASTTSDLVVNYTMGGTAAERADYTGTAGSITIPAGATHAYLTITPVNDSLPEGVESIIANITPAPGTYGLRTSSATLLLADNDAFPSGTVSFATATSSVAEDIGIHYVPVNLSGSPAGPIQVSYTVLSGTATGDGQDFTLANGTLDFPQGITTLQIPVVVHQDLLAEPSEDFEIKLFNVSGGNLGSSSHRVTINNLSLPEAFTTAPTSVAASSVTLNGRTQPNGLATTVWFEYGPNNSYGSTTGTQNVGSGTSSVNVTAALTGFAPGGYHYRCVARNIMGTTYGINQIIPSNNANLTNLVTSAGLLSPAFTASTSEYTCASSSTTATVTPTTAQAGAVVRVNGALVTSGSPSATLPLPSNSNTISILVTAQDGISTRSYTLSVLRKASQTITFAPLPAATYGDSDFSLAATASSGLQVSYASSNLSVATVTGSTVSITGAGTTTISAVQPGDGSFEPAVPVHQTLLVQPGLDTPVIYEPFADLDIDLQGNSPGSGLAGNWISGGIGVAPAGLGFGDLPTIGGMAIKPGGSGFANASVTIGPALNSAQLLHDGATLWFSFLYKRPPIPGSDGQAAFSIGDSSISGAPGNSMSSGSYGFGVVLGQGARVQAATWNNGMMMAAPPITTVIQPGATVLIVGKIAWNLDPTKPDHLQLYLPGTNLVRPFRPHSFTSGVLNQSSFDTFGFGVENTQSPTVDEIRFGHTYRSVTGQRVPGAGDPGTDGPGYDPLASENIGADPDGDGFSNLLEHAFGTDFGNPDGGAVVYDIGGEVAVPGHPTLLTESTALGPQRSAVFGRRRGYQSEGLAYTVQFAADLKTWVDSLDTPVVLTGTGGSFEIEAVSVPFPDSVNGPDGLQRPAFFRVRVEKQ